METLVLVVFLPHITVPLKGCKKKAREWRTESMHVC